jgi:hypothetical protein
VPKLDAIKDRLQKHLNFEWREFIKIHIFIFKNFGHESVQGQKNKV